MLILGAYINNNLIETIMIQNVGEVGNGVYKYRIREPEGHNTDILHLRKEGWKSLAKKVLDYLLAQEILDSLHKEG